MKLLNCHLTINVTELDRSIAFYESIGFTLDQRWGEHYAQLKGPGMEIGLHPTEAAVNHEGNPMSIGLTTPDFAQSKTELQKLQIPFTERSEEGGDFLHFVDPDGASLYFINPKW